MQPKKRYPPIVCIMILCLLAMAGCTKPPLSVRGTDNATIQVEFLFENDGVKVYRFTDSGRYIYYTDARGRTQWMSGSKNEVKNSVDTTQ